MKASEHSPEARKNEIIVVCVVVHAAAVGAAGSASGESERWRQRAEHATSSATIGASRMSTENPTPMPSSA